MRTTCGSSSKNVHASPSCRWQARLPVPSPTAATRVKPPLRGAGRCDRVSDRPAEIVIRERLRAAGYRRSIRFAYAFGAMQGRPVQQEPMRAARRSSTTRCTPKKLRTCSIRVNAGSQASNDERRAPRGRRSRPVCRRTSTIDASQENQPDFDRQRGFGVERECGATLKVSSQRRQQPDRGRSAAETDAARQRTRRALPAAPPGSGWDTRRCR